MTQDEARKILLKELPEGDSVEDVLEEIELAIAKNDRMTNSVTEADLLKPWTKSLGLKSDKLVEILIALKVL